MKHLLATEEQIAQYEKVLGKALHKSISENHDSFIEELNNIETYDIETNGIEEFCQMLRNIYILVQTFHQSLSAQKHKDDFSLYLMSKAREQMCDNLLWGHLFYLTHMKYLDEGEKEREA